MTTDTHPKLACATFHSGKAAVNVLGVAKGAGMIHPQLATMLVYLFTDAAATPAELKRFLQDACEQTFNSISIDGDTSTNDTVLLLASGQSGVRLRLAARCGRLFAGAAGSLPVSGRANRVRRRRSKACDSPLRRTSEEVARKRGRLPQTVAHSLLVKTAWAGADPNWGRILAAVGRSGIAIDPARVSIEIGDQMVCRGGVGCAFDEKRAHRALAQPCCEIRILLGRGSDSILFRTTDLTAEYVRINADYST